MLNDHAPIFGKNVLETLSEGMYDNPLFLFREYVQNAADAIDAAEKNGILGKGTGEIVVTIDPARRFICFEDNGIGIRLTEVTKMLANIGDSQKDRKTSKGFRGIGRLGGLGYCQTVRFETSFQGEAVQTTLEWDAHAMHEILADKNEHMTAGQLIQHITTTSSHPCDEEKHFFRVSLINVNNNSGELLEIEEIRKYLAMVAPVPFDYVKFRFVEEIEQFLKKNKLPKPHEYQLFVNGEDIRKGYEDPLKIEDSKSVDILGVECHTIKADNKIIGWYWFCIRRFEGVLPKKCWQRCIRLRKANIQIGEADCLSNHPRRGVSLWKEDRGNNYFIGEIHALDEDLIPNSRRDYFNQDDACRRFETALTEAFKNLDKLYHDASKLRSETSKIQKANQARKDFEAKEKAGEFLNQQEREEAQTEVEKLEASSKAAQKRIDKIYDKAKGGAIEKVADEYMPDILNILDKVEDKTFAPKEEPQKGYAEDNIKQETMRVLKTVFDVLDKVLPPDQSELVREAIIRMFVNK